MFARAYPLLAVIIFLLTVQAAARAGELQSEPAARSVAIVVHDGVELLDFAGPAEVFANVSYRGQRAFNVYTVAPTLAPCKSQQNVTIMPEYSIDNCPPPAIVVIPGGATQNLTSDPRFMDWVKRTSEKAEVTMTVCTGAFTLADQGLLDGLEATTHFSAIPALKSEHPQVRVRENVRFVDNGKIVTTAGISAGIDGALHVVSRLTSEEAAWLTARQMEYNWQPPPIPLGEATHAALLAREGLENRVARRWDKAAAAYEKLLKLDPENAEATTKLAQCQMGLEHWSDAARNFKRAQELGRNDAFLVTLMARCQLGAGQYNDAVKTYEQAIELGQDDVINTYNLACSYALTNQKAKALDTLQRALEKGPYMKKQAVKDEDFASIREDERFKAMVAGK